MFKTIKVELYKKEGDKPHSFSTMIEIPEGTTSTGLTESIKARVEYVMNCNTTSIAVKVGKEDIKQDWVFSANDNIKAKIYQQ